MTLGFIGQGWIGKNYADHYERRGFSVVRYSKEHPYILNRDVIKKCDIVFIAVPTPSTPHGFDDSVVREAVSLVGKGKIALIKSTIIPGTTRSIQQEYPGIYVLHSPEFLREATAREDVDNPDRNIVGISSDESKWQEAAEKVISIMPKAPYQKVCRAEEAELIKYGGNIFLFWKVLCMNILYDVASHHGADWGVVSEAMIADPRIGTSHMNPVHASGHTKIAGRGAGGHCFIKDFAALHDHYKNTVGDEFGVKIFEALRDENIHLLHSTGKDIDLLEGVYGEYVRQNKFK
jgi:nucleotide sugar dehydrogenase